MKGVLRREEVNYRPTGRYRLVKQLERRPDGTYRVSYRTRTDGTGPTRTQDFRFRDPAQHFYDALPGAFRPSPTG